MVVVDRSYLSRGAPVIIIVVLRIFIVRELYYNNSPTTHKLVVRFRTNIKNNCVRKVSSRVVNMNTERLLYSNINYVAVLLHHTV